ncbi:hypothetical protein [Neobacillus massiliamazoniensis]|uniref:Uncharacterized protein n=1 Tax=Neobacillus massiliamazoniensis TaxID=1499688 RepID=A0A0U1NXD7_9BACI|nr:hypothetical protein [Neobacillus massiliamazoniensis]CRK82673.1 hypothetical protein BN000_02616 [Neobacillus massiliamazoniensis]
MSWHDHCNRDSFRWAASVCDSVPAGGVSLRSQSADNPIKRPRREMTGLVQPLERQMEMERIRKEIFSTSKRRRRGFM